MLSLGPCVWEEYENTNVAGSVPQRDLTVGECQMSCINTLYCVGIDVDTNPQSTFCWLSILPEAGGPMQPFNGVTHYVLTRNVGCPYMGESVFVRKSYKSKDQNVELPRAVADPARARGHVIYIKQKK